MKKITAFEKAIENQVKDLRAVGINPTLFWAYRNSIEAENERIDFGECIWENEIEDITNCLKQNGIYEFTISSTFSGLIEILAIFEKHGFQMAGLTEVNATYTDWQTKAEVTEGDTGVDAPTVTSWFNEVYEPTYA